MLTFWAGAGETDISSLQCSPFPFKFPCVTSVRSHAAAYCWISVTLYRMSAVIEGGQNRIQTPRGWAGVCLLLLCVGLFYWFDCGPGLWRALLWKLCIRKAVFVSRTAWRCSLVNHWAFFFLFLSTIKRELSPVVWDLEILFKTEVVLCGLISSREWTFVGITSGTLLMVKCFLLLPWFVMHRT